jgi:hypothetical protein
MIALFVLKLSAGITLMWLLMPRKEVTDGFFRIQMRLLLGTTVLTVLLLSRSMATETSGITKETIQVFEWIRELQIGSAVVAYLGSIFWALGRRTPGNICILLLGLTCTGTLALHSTQFPGQAGWLLQLSSDLASAAVLGATLTGMLLGHWYLTTPTMSIRPLRWFIGILIASAALRLLCSGLALFRFGFSIHEVVYGLWLGMRLAGGIVVPAVAAVLVWKVLQYRNTQSATGILFAGLILVFMGEMTGVLLEHATRIPY